MALMSPGSETMQQSPGGIYYSGLDNTRHRVVLEATDALRIIEQGAELAAWAYADIRRMGGATDRLRLSSVAAPELARLEIADPAAAAMLTRLCPNLDRGDSSQTRGSAIAKIIVWSLAAAASILAIAIYGVPLAADRLAPLVPAALEIRIGEMVDGQVKALFGDKLCNKPEGQAALVKLVGALRAAGGVVGTVDAAVLSTRIPNAIALPGGKVYVFAPLLDKAESPDELGGVIAHELGHVHNRDGMRRVIQTGGTSFLIGLLFGDVTGSGAAILIGRELLDSSYSREAETRADAFAIGVLGKLGRSPKPLGEFLMRLTGGHDSKAMAILASHPLTQDRLAAMTKADTAATGAPLLSVAEWQALKAICGAAP